MFGAMLQRLTKAAIASGRRGERIAARHLKRAGYRILGRNLRTRLGEIDLLAEDPDGRTIVIVEVKSGVGSPAPPEHHVTRAKQRKLTGLAANLARRHNLTDRPLRFDVVAVEFHRPRKHTLRHHVGAFESHV